MMRRIYIVCAQIERMARIATAVKTTSHTRGWEYTYYHARVPLSNTSTLLWIKPSLEMLKRMISNNFLPDFVVLALPRGSISRAWRALTGDARILRKIHENIGEPFTELQEDSRGRLLLYIHDEYIEVETSCPFCKEKTTFSIPEVGWSVCPNCKARVEVSNDDMSPPPHAQPFLTREGEIGYMEDTPMGTMVVYKKSVGGVVLSFTKSLFELQGDDIYRIFALRKRYEEERRRRDIIKLLTQARERGADIPPDEELETMNADELEDLLHARVGYPRR